MTELLTERLRLRIPVEADLDGFTELTADPATARHIGGLRTRPIAWRGMASIVGSWSLRGHGMFSVIERASGRWIGRAGPWYPEGWPAREIGWGFLASAHGRGFATEAAAACMDFAVDRLGWDDLVHTISPENTASIGVARRLGSTDRGPVRMPDPYADDLVHAWGQTASEWRSGRTTRSGRS